MRIPTPGPRALAAATACTLALTAAGTHALTIVPNYLLTYDAADGSLTIQTYGDLITYLLETDDDPLVDDGFIQANHAQLPGNAGFNGNPKHYFTSTDGQIADTNPDFWDPIGPISLGNVLPAGLSEIQLNDLLSRAQYVKQQGQVPSPNDWVNFDIAFVPEPTSLLLMAGGALLLARRRR